jgi:hypothetical protein
MVVPLDLFSWVLRTERFVPHGALPSRSRSMLGVTRMTLISGEM